MNKNEFLGKYMPQIGKKVKDNIFNVTIDHEMTPEDTLFPFFYYNENINNALKELISRGYICE